MIPKQPAKRAPKNTRADMVECPSCRNWLTEHRCDYCGGSGEVTEQQFLDFGDEP